MKQRWNKMLKQVEVGGVSAGLSLWLSCQSNCKLDAGMWRYDANRMDARRSQFDLGRVVAYI